MMCFDSRLFQTLNTLQRLQTMIRSFILVESSEPALPGPAHAGGGAGSQFNLPWLQYQTFLLRLHVIRIFLFR